jgi:hypothetical protein
LFLFHERNQEVRGSFCGSMIPTRSYCVVDESFVPHSLVLQLIWRSPCHLVNVEIVEAIMKHMI